jgi:hypothetical protein
MPVTTLDTTAALIVIDLQKGIVGIPTSHPGDIASVRDRMACTEMIQASRTAKAHR